MDELMFFAGALVIGFPLAVIYFLVSQWKLYTSHSKTRTL